MKYPRNKLIVQPAAEAPGDEAIIVYEGTSNEWDVDMLYYEFKGTQKWYITHADEFYKPEKNRKLTSLEKRMLIEGLLGVGIKDDR